MQFRLLVRQPYVRSASEQLVASISWPSPTEPASRRASRATSTPHAPAPNIKAGPMGKRAQRK